MPARFPVRMPAPRPRGAPDLRPPRYRLMTAAARLTSRPRADLSVTYHRDCPACGELVLCTETHRPDGVVHAIEDHDCSTGVDGAVS